MDELLPAGVISHGFYGRPQSIPNSPRGPCNRWGVQRPGKRVSFAYQEAKVGAGFISCEGQRVCGATMTADGFGRWAVPSAKDVPGLLNILGEYIQAGLEYQELTTEKIYEIVSTSMRPGNQDGNQNFNSHDADVRLNSNLRDFDVRLSGLEQMIKDRLTATGQAVEDRLTSLEGKRLTSPESPWGAAATHKNTWSSNASQEIETRMNDLEQIVRDLQCRDEPRFTFNESKSDVSFNSRSNQGGETRMKDLEQIVRELQRKVDAPGNLNLEQMSADSRINSLEQNIRDFQQKANAPNHGVDSRITSLEQNIRDFQQNTTAPSKGVDNRITTLEQSIRDIQHKAHGSISTLEQKIRDLQEKVGGPNSRASNMEQPGNDSLQMVKELHQQNQDLQEYCANANAKNATMEAGLTHVKEAHQQNKGLQEYCANANARNATGQADRAQSCNEQAKTAAFDEKDWNQKSPRQKAVIVKELQQQNNELRDYCTNANARNATQKAEILLQADVAQSRNGQVKTFSPSFADKDWNAKNRPADQSPSWQKQTDSSGFQPLSSSGEWRTYPTSPMGSKSSEYVRPGSAVRPAVQASRETDRMERNDPANIKKFNGNATTGTAPWLLEAPLPPPSDPPPDATMSSALFGTSQSTSGRLPSSMQRMPTPYDDRLQAELQAGGMKNQQMDFTRPSSTMTRCSEYNYDSNTGQTPWSPSSWTPPSEFGKPPSSSAFNTTPPAEYGMTPTSPSGFNTAPPMLSEASFPITGRTTSKIGIFQGPDSSKWSAPSNNTMPDSTKWSMPSNNGSLPSNPAPQVSLLPAIPGTTTSSGYQGPSQKMDGSRQSEQQCQQQ